MNIEKKLLKAEKLIAEVRAEQKSVVKDSFTTKELFDIIDDIKKPKDGQEYVGRWVLSGRCLVFCTKTLRNGSEIIMTEGYGIGILGWHPIDDGSWRLKNPTILTNDEALERLIPIARGMGFVEGARHKVFEGGKVWPITKYETFAVQCGELYLSGCKILNSSGEWATILKDEKTADQKRIEELEAKLEGAISLNKKLNARLDEVNRITNN